MQKANPIHRRHMGWGYGNGKAKSLRGWAATCPTCNGEIADYYSRKKAKDALYRHGQKEHGPGSVGR